MTASLNKSQMKGKLFRKYCRKKVTSLSKAPCQLYLQFKWPFAQDKIVLWEEKKNNCSVIWTYLPYSSDSFIHSLWWQLKATQKRVVLPLATTIVKTFPVPPSFGATPAVPVKEFKRIFFQSRKEAKESKLVNELRTFLQRNQWKTI